MPIANTSLSLTSLDFDAYKDSLKAYLKTQSAFKDYDYEGSNINVLLDVLSLNTYKMAYYLNMVASEMMLDSAQLRSTISSHAKQLNYLPRSVRSSMAKIDITVATSNATSFTIPKGTPFGATNNNGNFTFTTDKSITVASSNNTFLFPDLEIFEGTYIQETFLIDYSNETQKFTILNENVDTRSISVIVSENDGQTVTEFLLADSLYALTPTSNKYFLQTDIDAKYQVVFGDNTFGRTPADGAVITVEYRISDGIKSNGIGTFAMSADLSAINNTEILSNTIEVTEIATGAADLESIESIRYNAPRHFQTQERAVTTNDYEDLIKFNFNDVQSVGVFGGEDSLVAPVSYGKVFISCTTFSGDALTESRKTDIAAFLKPRTTIGITPILIDPEYVYLTLIVNAHIDFNETALVPEQLKTAIAATVATYNEDYLQQFKKNFRLSTLMSLINLTDVSIMSNEISVYMYKKLTPTIGIYNSLSMDFGTPLKPGSILSNRFLSNSVYYVYTDTIDGVVNPGNILYRLEQATISSTTQNYYAAGTIDYNKGTIVIDSEVYDQMADSTLKMFATPKNQDVYSTRNQILVIDTASGVNINVLDG